MSTLSLEIEDCREKNDLLRFGRVLQVRLLRMFDLEHLVLTAEPTAVPLGVQHSHRYNASEQPEQSNKMQKFLTL